MAKLKEYNGRYCEWEFEYTFLSCLEAEGWQYLPGGSIPRSSQREVLYIDDLEQFLSKTNPDLTAEEVRQIMDTVRLAGAESDFATLHKVYGWMVYGIQFIPQASQPRMIPLIDYEKPENNIFRAVNQFTVEYTNNGQTKTRRPDILLFVNGDPAVPRNIKCLYQNTGLLSELFIDIIVSQRKRIASSFLNRETRGGPARRQCLPMCCLLSFEAHGFLIFRLQLTQPNPVIAQQIAGQTF